MTKAKITHIHVCRRPGGAPEKGILRFGANHFPCRLGRSGITTRKIEGDGATPTGRFHILRGYYRPGNALRPRTVLNVERIKRNSGWCDDPLDANYNRPITTPYPRSHEEMMRKDRLYDLCLVLDYNILPRIRNRGSAVFFHLTHPEGKPTQGCVAVDPDVMRRILPMIGPSTQVHVHA